MEGGNLAKDINIYYRINRGIAVPLLYTSYKWLISLYVARFQPLGGGTNLEIIF